MNNEQKTSHITPESTFIKAACKFFKCKPDKANIRMINDGQEALVVYMNEQYIVTTKNAIQDYIDFQLTDIGAALHLNIHTWIRATENTVSIERFLPQLIDKLEGDEAHLLHLALSFNSYTIDKYKTFWNALIAIDKRGKLLGKAIVTTREVYSGHGLLEDLTELTILNGINDLNMLQDGIFETIHIDDDQMPEFFIYSVSDYPIE
jgi:hypothetical protein